MNPKRARDYKAEYRRRIDMGKARGYSRAQAAGHPKPNEIGIVRGREIIEESKNKKRKESTLLMVATSPCVACICTGAPEHCKKLDEWVQKLC